MQGASGWDWMGMHLQDGSTLMAFRIRDAKSQTLFAHWDHRDAAGRVLGQGSDAVFVPQSVWRSPHSLHAYPIEMDVRIAGRSYRLAPLMQDQEVDARASTGGFYWEGAVRLMQGDRTIGRGYLELTGYGEPLQL
jgi:predicted secreted hydrolase